MKRSNNDSGAALKGGKSLSTTSKGQITSADYSSEDYRNIKVPVHDQNDLDRIYNSSVPYEARVFESTATFEGQEEQAFEQISNEDESWADEERIRQKSLSFYRRPSIYMMGAVIIFYTFSYGLSLSSRLQLMMELICKGVTSGDIDDVKCNTNPTVQKKISDLESAMTIVGNTLATIASGKVGELSDQYGRKRTIVGTATILLVSRVLVLSLIHPLVNTYHPVLLVLASAIENFSGGTAAFIALSNTYVADITVPEDRMAKMGILAGCIFVGLGLGPFLSSLLIRHFHSNLIPCYIDVVFVIVLLVFSLIVLPESRSERARQKSRTVNLIQIERQRLSGGENGSLLISIQKYFIQLLRPLNLLLVKVEVHPLTKVKSYSRRYEVLTLMSVMTFFMLGSVYMGRVFILYPTYVFKWTAPDIGLFVALMMASRAVILLIVSPYLLKYLRRKLPTKHDRVDRVDSMIMRVSLVCEFLGSILLTFATSSNTYRASQLVTCFGALMSPVIDSMLVKYSPVDKVGQMLGAVAMVKNFLAAVAPSGLLLIYSATVKTNPRIVLYVMLGFLAVANFLSFFLKPTDSEPIESDANTSGNQYGSTADSSQD